MRNEALKYKEFQQPAYFEKPSMPISKRFCSSEKVVLLLETSDFRLTLLTMKVTNIKDWGRWSQSVHLSNIFQQYDVRLGVLNHACASYLWSTWHHHVQRRASFCASFIWPFTDACCWGFDPGWSFPTTFLGQIRESNLDQTWSWLDLSCGWYVCHSAVPIAKLGSTQWCWTTLLLCHDITVQMLNGNVINLKPY